jgi:tartrate/fumarate subfamily iron-sulfur-dependent hydro-lyase beta chain
VQKLCNEIGIGAQFGGKYFAHDVRVIRLPRHGASCPVGIGVSCSADRQVKAKINAEGVFLEQLETNPAKYLPEITPDELGGEVVRIDLRRPMAEILAELSKHPVATRLSLTGPMVVARDIAHAKLKERLDSGGDLPQYFKDHMVYYAGPAKRPEGHASGSFGPTTAGRMDSYVDLFQSRGGSMVMLAKGNRSAQVREACAKHGGFYLGSIGGPARYGLRVCQCGHRRVHRIRPVLGARRRQHDLQQLRGLRPGQLAREQPVDPGLRRAAHTPGTVLRRARADVELLRARRLGPSRGRRSVVGGCRAAAVRAWLPQ